MQAVIKGTDSGSCWSGWCRCVVLLESIHQSQYSEQVLGDDYCRVVSVRGQLIVLCRSVTILVVYSNNCTLCTAMASPHTWFIR